MPLELGFILIASSLIITPQHAGTLALGTERHHARGPETGQCGQDRRVPGCGLKPKGWAVPGVRAEICGGLLGAGAWIMAARVGVQRRQGRGFTHSVGWGRNTGRPGSCGLHPLRLAVSPWHQARRPVWEINSGAGQAPTNATAASWPPLSPWYP